MKRKVLIATIARIGMCLIVAAIIFGAIFIDAEFIHYNIYAGIEEHNKDVLESLKIAGYIYALVITLMFIGESLFLLVRKKEE